MANGNRLGIDFGTSNTIAVLGRADGNVRLLLFDGSPTLPSAVLAQPDGTFLVGRDAVHAARTAPESFEPNPKRRVDEGEVLLGGRPVPVVELFAAVFGRVCAEARRVTGEDVVDAALTCPASWAQTRRQLLMAAAERAGLTRLTLTAEPVAAASYFVRTLGARVPASGCVVIYDLGGGTFDASVVRRTGTGFDVLATEGLDASGGLDIDAAIVDYISAIFAARAEARWERLSRPENQADRRASQLLWDDVRVAKEMLSRAASTRIHVPVIDEDVPLGREQLEELARPILGRTVQATRLAVAAAGVAERDVFGLFLVGGASRIPLVATLLHQAFGRPPTIIEQPEVVVAQGSLAASPLTAPLPTPPRPAPPPPDSPPQPTSAPISSAAVSAQPVSPPVRPLAPTQRLPISPPVPPQRQWSTHGPAVPVPPPRPPTRRPVVLVAALVSLVLVTVLTVALLNRHEPSGGQTTQAATTSTAAARTNTASNAAAAPAPSVAVASSQPPALADFYIGTWSGPVSDTSGSGYTMTVVLTTGNIGDKVGHATYTTLNCSGSWQLTATLANEVRLTETIDNDPGNECLQTVLVSLAPAGAKMTVNFRDAPSYSSEPLGHATLTKQ